MPATTWSVNRHLPGLSRANDYLSVLMASLRFRHFISGSLVFVSIGAYLTKSRFAFSATLTTMAFRPQQLAVVWSLHLSGGSGGPSPIFG